MHLHFIFMTLASTLILQPPEWVSDSATVEISDLGVNSESLCDVRV